MITRPLDLVSKLRAAPPRGFDALFWVNVGLRLFFGIFGSRFVLAPGLGVDFDLPEIGGARAAAVRTTHVISMAHSGLIFTDDGALGLEQLGAWLATQQARWREAANADHPAAARSAPVEAVLLIRASASIPVADLAAVTSTAQSLGFRVQIAALEPSGSATGEGTAE